MFVITFVKGELHIQHTLEMSHQCANRDHTQHLQKKTCGVRCGGSFDAKKENVTLILCLLSWLQEITSAAAAGEHVEKQAFASLGFKVKTAFRDYKR